MKAGTQGLWSKCALAAAASLTLVGLCLDGLTPKVQNASAPTLALDVRLNTSVLTAALRLSL